MSDRNIELHIDELVLRGFAAGDRMQIAEALQTELTNLLMRDSAATGMRQSLNIDRIHAGSFQVARGAKPAAIGAQLAQSVYRQVGPAVLGRREARTKSK